MKTHSTVSSSRRVQRRTHFQAPSHVRYTLMSASLSKELRKKHGVRSLPVRKDDEVVIVRGSHKKEKGKVIAVYRKKWCLHIEKITKTKANGMPVQVPIDASNVMITKLKLLRDRENLIARKAAGTGKGKGKYTKEDKLDQ